MRVEALDHVQLAMPAGGEAAARHFYAGILDIPEVDKPPHLAKRGGCWFERGSLRVHLGVDRDFRPAKKVHPAFVVTDFVSLVQYLADAGFEAIQDEAFAGVDRCYVDDPFGSRLELMEPI